MTAVVSFSDKQSATIHILDTVESLLLNCFRNVDRYMKELGDSGGEDEDFVALSQSY